MDLQIIQNKIFEVRGCRVMLDLHLAELYQVETRALKQAVKRNIDRFPSDFMFELSKDVVKQHNHKRQPCSLYDIRIICIDTDNRLMEYQRKRNQR